jgi:hypothetical protein
LGAFLLWLAIPAVLAQETRGQILGRVVDQSGVVVVGATVRAMNAGTNVETTSTTNESGDYMLPLLISGKKGLWNTRQQQSGDLRALCGNSYLPSFDTRPTNCVRHRK